MTNLKSWTLREMPRRTAMYGRLVRLEPLDAGRHGDELYAASQAAVSGERFRYLFEDAPANREAFDLWMKSAAAQADPMFFAVIDLQSGAVVGRQAFMRIDAKFGVIEIGSIFWGTAIARRPQATEALYLFARHAFDEIGYRRFEWKCDARNAPSRAAALRFGFAFEGIFRQHMIVKGQNRDTAWYSMLDGEWAANRQAFEAWLAPDNFGKDGIQRRRLDDIRAEIAGRR